MFVWQPVVLGILVFKVGVTLLALLCSEVLKVFWAFFCITKLVLKINTRTILTTIDGPKRKDNIEKGPLALGQQLKLADRVLEGRKPELLSC